ncbi:MAG: ABC transporter ATP-binding protein/permease [Defluviitaleaceae bacterium]|nr:ABC transporter ATP-binding protein/permease [Defluviitaleaceae bacterium]
MRRHSRRELKAIRATRPKVTIARVIGYGFRFILSYTPWMLVVITILSVFNGLLHGASIFATQLLFDAVENAVTGEGLLRTAYFMLFIMGTAFILREVFNGADGFLQSAMMDKLAGGIQRRIHKKMSRIDPVAFENVSFHDDMEKADRGKWNVLGLTMTIHALFAFYLPYFIFMGFWLHHISPRFVLAIVIAFLPTAFGQIIRTKIISKFVDITAPIRREHDFYYNAITHTRYYKETRLLGIYDFFMGRFSGMLKKLSRAELSANRKTNLLDLGLSLLSTSGYVVILFMLISALLSGEISVGAFAAVYGSIGAMFNIMEEIIRHRLGQAAEGMGFAHNLIRFMDLPEREVKKPAVSPEAAPENIGGAISGVGITMQNVSFTYPLTENKSIDSVDLEVAPGETIAIVGENGAGKSTLVRLLIGLYKPDEGKVLFNGISTDEMGLKDLHQRVSGVFQRYQRYNLSLKDNVQMGDKSSEAEITECLVQAGISLDAATFPAGGDTMLGREFDGVDLSGGQWQRVAIARGLYRIHDVIVLDEPTAAIDPIEESRIYEKFIEISKDKTAVIVTHRLGSTKIADRIIVVENGKITAAGRHDELMATDGTYAKMFNAQAKWYEYCDTN